MTEKLKIVNETQLELERHYDDDCEVVNHYYIAKKMHSDIPFYLQDENGETFEFGWNLIYQYIAKLTQEDEDELFPYPDY
jgi:hypothetical protein